MSPEAEPNPRLARAEFPAPKSFGIIGHGNFGSLLETLTGRFAPGLDVRIFSPDDKPDSERFFSLAETASSDIVTLAVPISQYESVLKAITPSLRPESTLVDIATVKEHTTKLIKTIAPGQRFLSMHPMFGPQSYKNNEGIVAGFKVVMTDTNLPQAEMAVVRNFLTQTGAELIEMTPEEHDRDTVNLFLTHLAAQVFSRAGLRPTRIDTPASTEFMNAVDSVKGDGALFRDVYKYNRFCPPALEMVGIAEEEVHRLYLSPED